MTDKTLLSIIKTLNGSLNKDYIVLSQISESVSFGKVWIKSKMPRHGKTLSEPYSFYFLKSADGKYIGTVLDMTIDLHWYVAREFRGKGYLSNALREFVLPHILQSREEILITIDKNMLTKKNARSSRNLAVSVGFCFQGSPSLGLDEYCLAISYDKLVNQLFASPITETKMLNLKGRLKDLYQELMIIQNELIVQSGYEDVTDHLQSIAEGIRSTGNNLSDSFYDLNQ